VQWRAADSTDTAPPGPRSCLAVLQSCSLTVFGRWGVGTGAALRPRMAPHTPDLQKGRRAMSYLQGWPECAVMSIEPSGYSSHSGPRAVPALVCFRFWESLALCACRDEREQPSGNSGPTPPPMTQSIRDRAHTSPHRSGLSSSSSVLAHAELDATARSGRTGRRQS
jgi:hypothetical protein